MFSLSPFLYRDVILAVFNLSGKLPHSNDIYRSFSTIPHNKSQIPIYVVIFMGKVYVPVSMQHKN
jgi:hypothetical protein